MNGMAAFAFALFTIPLLTFVSAGMLELRRDRRSLRSLTRMLPLAVAVVVSVLLVIDIRYPWLSFRPSLSMTMSALSLLVAVCALVCRYADISPA